MLVPHAQCATIPVKRTYPFEELQSIFPILQHKLRQAPNHFNYSADLVVIGNSRKNRKPQKELQGNAAKRPDVYSAVVGQAQEDLCPRVRQGENGSAPVFKQSRK